MLRRRHTGVSAEASLDQIRLFVSSQTALTLATVGCDGTVRATPLFYLPADGLLLYWFSSQSSAHSRDCEHSSQASVAIHSAAGRWQQIRGVQMTGRVMAIKDGTLRQSIRRSFIEHFQLDGALRLAIKHSSLYCFSPEWIRYIDNSVRFGYKRELVIERKR